MKSGLWLREAAPTSLDARFHGHDVIPAKAGIQEFAQILEVSSEFFPQAYSLQPIALADR
jgi:hypothetical protein